MLKCPTIYSRLNAVLFVRIACGDIEWKHFPRYWPFVRGNHRSPVDSHHKASDAELCYSRANNRDVSGLRRHRVHYDVILVISIFSPSLVGHLSIGRQPEWPTCIDNLSREYRFLFAVGNYSLQYTK